MTFLEIVGPFVVMALLGIGFAFVCDYAAQLWESHSREEWEALVAQLKRDAKGGGK